MFDIDWDDMPDKPCACGFDDVSFPHSCKTEGLDLAESFNQMEQDLNPPEDNGWNGVF